MLALAGHQVSAVAEQVGQALLGAGPVADVGGGPGPGAEPVRSSYGTPSSSHDQDRQRDGERLDEVGGQVRRASPSSRPAASASTRGRSARIRPGAKCGWSRDRIRA
jgi:hypothetical protein